MRLIRASKTLRCTRTQRSSSRSATRAYGEAGAIKGKFALWFEEVYEELHSRPQFREVAKHAAGEVHDGYISQDKRTGAWKDWSESKGEGGATKDDEQAYELIMKDKERLLDLSTPLRFTPAPQSS